MNALFSQRIHPPIVEPIRDDELHRKHIELRFKEIERRIERLEQQSRVMKVGHR